MKIKELRELGPEDLINKEKVLKKELFELKYQRKTGRVEKPSRFKLIRRDIAKILTVMNEREKDGSKS
ncbi:MAG: 50S ribosomal protein L29 [Candidatus Omnitrophica bacterium]|nr:50S ribosomal protein L29 [Candidatus Omnitrophota bacterium]